LLLRLGLRSGVGLPITTAGTWTFFINLPIGLLSLLLTQRLVEDPPWLSEEKRAGIRIDYIGLALIVIGVACFQMVLFGSTVLIPEFLQSSLGYTAERAGMALSPGGLMLMLMMPVAGRLTATKMDPRLLIALGFVGTAIGLHIMTTIYLQIDFRTMVLLRMVQVSALPFIFIPISTLNYVGVPREKNNQVSGLSNFARNIGGSIGTSLLTTSLARQNQIHQRNFSAHTGQSDLNFQQLLNGLKATFMSQGFDAATSAQKALTEAYRIIGAQANALSFVNSFWIMSLIVLCLTPLPFIMKRPRPGQARARPAH
jgi:MFS transporter, DHA2 family, multidrug resistance protein